MSDYTPKGNHAAAASNAHIALLASNFNDHVVNGLLAGARRELSKYDIPAEQMEEIRVPGAFELPLAAKKLADSGRFDGIVALGAVIRGDTAHFEFVAGECTRGLGRVMLESEIPIGFGVLTCDKETQALDRANTKGGNKGEEAALAVLEMIAVLRRLG